VSWRGSPTNCTVARSIFYYTDSRTLGGAEQALFMLVAALDRTAWQPTLLLDRAPGVEPLAQRAAEFDIPVRFIPPMPLGLAGASRVPGLVRTLRAERPAVFHAHLSWPLAAKWALTAAILARVPAIVATVHLIPEFELDRSSWLQLRALSARVGRYIAVSRAIATELIERFRWPADKIEVVYNAVDLERFDVSASPARSDEQRPVVLTCARLDEQKGHRILLAAAAEVPEAVFVLAGDGPERAALEGKAAELGVSDRVRFLGHRTDVSELLATCDVFALPSFYEGSSLALLEAMAARRPVVSSAIGGTDELIEDGKTGLLVPPGDAGALGVALRKLLADASLRDSLASRARERVERDFSREEIGRRVTQIYEGLLDG
jgi:glycosyltransferase involved in cell wall biosynthesis